MNDGTYDGAPIEPQYIAELSSDVQVQYVQNTVWGLSFNCTDPVLSNTYLRMALCSAFSAQTLEMPDKNVARGILPAGCRVSDENYRDTAGTAEFPEENDERALLYMQFAVKELQQNSVSLQILCTEEYETAMRRIIQRWQKLFGVMIAASTAICSREELLTARANGAYQIAFLPLRTASSSAVQSLYAFWGTEDETVGTDSTDYAGLLQAALVAPNAASAASCCLQAESYLIRTGVFYPVFDDATVYAFTSGTTQIGLTPCGEAISFVRARKTG